MVVQGQAAVTGWKNIVDKTWQGLVAATPTSPGQLTPEQLANAQSIIATGKKLGIPPHGIAIALATAAQESSLRNLPGGDRDSVGLFQQRPSQGWGTVAQLRDPEFAATQFYNALKKVPNWQNLPLTVAAQRVQRSAYPDAYAKWEPLANALVQQYGG
jgi:hypothetical protein